ncbi:electron transfer flavoprotein subunit alpha/FixB family protein [Dethiosulfatarculus sandiegensis]|uniref:Electron transfer flavoprotein subunit alpha n=1 Tax=Dethiosulfatarculus sandiegensis TaxID=1429043 RepID=A0A0D2J9A9_9BACT|nr:electron transfer flavoprotein subunit alpha/FixB family protein [Dethiosulfatarculus sandiegensis]KIX14739.1 electron transfer flavoprotein subunit alpha [Dethiosulfatarculus sandiegensis]
MAEAAKSIWVFGDYRNYFQNRVTLQLIARAKELARQDEARVCVLVFGHKTGQWVHEYVAHGADVVYVMDHVNLSKYQIETFTRILVGLANEYKPGIILVGATGFGKELAARTARELGTGLTADCVDLFINEKGEFVQTAPAFGGNLLAEILIPKHSPKMATVRPGTFQELPHDEKRTAQVIELPLPQDLPPERVIRKSIERLPHRAQSLEQAKVVVLGGRGMGSKKKFKNLLELARLLRAEVGATRPVVHANWAEEDMLVGQAGKNIKPKILFSFGISGAIQHTAGFGDIDFIVAVNKNPVAQMMQMADVAIQADANQVCLAMIRELKERLK